MDFTRRLDRVAPLAALVSAAALLLTRLYSSGIWDPWELDVAERARLGEALVDRPPLAEALVRLGFRTFGASEWSGRLPLALAALALVGITMLLARRTTDRRGYAYAAIVAATSPLLLSNARSMLGDAGTMAAQALLGLLAIEAAFPSNAIRSRRALTLAMLPVAALLAIAFRGALLGALPPLLGVSLVLLLEGRCRPTRSPRPVFELLIVIATFALTLHVAFDVLADRAEYRWALGGIPRGENPPPFEAGLATLFHSFAPWSPLAILAAGKVFASSPDAEDAATAESRAIELVFVTWAAFAYAAATIFGSRYGTGVYLAIAPLAALVGGYVRRVEKERTPDRTSLVVAVLLVGLLIRDFMLYPVSPLEGLAVTGLQAPMSLQRPVGWAIVLVGFAVALTFAFGSSASPSDARDSASLRDRARSLYERAPRVAMRAGVATAVVLGLLALASILAWILGVRLGIPTIAVRALRLVLPIELALALAVVAADFLVRVFARLGELRFLPLMVVGLATGVYVIGAYLPALGNDLSPRDAYTTYNELRGTNDRLVVFRSGIRAAPYYVHGPVESAETQAALVTHLSAADRRFAILPRDSLTQVDGAFRQTRGTHLVVVDGRSSRLVLVTNSPIPGRRDENPIASSVTKTPPHPQFPLNARFGDSIELVGYDLDLPHAGYVGAGEIFSVTWHFHAKAKPPAGQQLFLHIDGFGLRLNGDHVPVDGLVPLVEWTPGDYIADRQELTVPSNFRPGEYTMWLGFFFGENRMPVTSGAKDDSNRANAGRLTVR